MRKFVIAAVAFLVAAGAWWYLSPYWTLRQMQSAAQKGDARKFSEYVDYPAVRQDLKGEFRRAILKEAAASKQNGGFAVLGSAFALALINPLIDTMVTPEGLEAAFAHRKQVAATGKVAKLPEAPADPLIERDGLERFTVHDKDPSKGSLVFARYGLGWKLVGFELPRSQGDAMPGAN
jgi:hypothetical protein